MFNWQLAPLLLTIKSKCISLGGNAVASFHCGLLAQLPSQTCLQLLSVLAALPSSPLVVVLCPEMIYGGLKMNEGE